MPAPTSPRHARLLRDFANTLDVETGTDDLTDPRALTAWLRTAGLLEGAARAATATELDLALRLRDGLREAMRAHHDGGAYEPGTLQEAATALPLRLDCSRATPRLEPGEGGVRGALARLLVAVADSVADSTWPRLKLCRAPDCAMAFHDVSKNHSRAWCSMGLCGNRQKTRAYRTRQRLTPG